jgi:PilZ domain-containing protein
VATARLGPLYSRRFVSRIETHEHVWVCWRCEGIEDISRVCDLSVGGVFLCTPTSRPLGARVKLEFLIPEGQIRAEAIVQHVIPHGGLGLKFTAITDQDCPNLVALISRICMPARSLPVTTTVYTSLDL